VILSML